MRITNNTWRARIDSGREWLDFVSSCFAKRLRADEHPLRFYISKIENGWVEVEVTLVQFSADDRYAEALREIEILSPRKRSRRCSRFVVANVVPTGIRCEFGGYAGDATPVTNLLASISEFVVTHPNAVNASDINELASNVLYVEGRSLDDLMLGHVGLRTVGSNRIGTFVDSAGESLIDDVVHVLNAARAVAGMQCDDATILDCDLDVQVEWTGSGCASGVIGRPDAILRGVESLIARGAQAVGGVSVIHGVTADMFKAHLEGRIPNPSGAVEAVITHLISKLFRIPTAHAPLPYDQDSKARSTQNPRASAEFISTPHYFSVLKGLHRAPEIVSCSGGNADSADLITLNDIAAVVAPADALGGVPALAAAYNRIPLIAVRSNGTILDVSASKLGIKNVIEVETYLEAAGVLAALRSGIALDSLQRPLRETSVESLPDAESSRHVEVPENTAVGSSTGMSKPTR